MSLFVGNLNVLIGYLVGLVVSFVNIVVVRIMLLSFWSVKFSVKWELLILMSGIVWMFLLVK